MFNVKRAIVKLYDGENQLCFNNMMVMSALY